MRYGIVEGEPGIFPDPIARFLRWLGRLGQQQKPDQPEHRPKRDKDKPST